MSAVVNKGPLYNASRNIDEEELDLGDLLGVVIENRWFIIAITLVSLLVGGYKAFTATPIYRADGLLQVEENQTGGLTALDVTTQAQILELLTELVREFGMGLMMITHDLDSFYRGSP